MPPIEFQWRRFSESTQIPPHKASIRLNMVTKDRVWFAGTIDFDNRDEEFQKPSWVNCEDTAIRQYENTDR